MARPWEQRREELERKSSSVWNDFAAWEEWFTERFAPWNDWDLDTAWGDAKTAGLDVAIYTAMCELADNAADAAGATR